MPEWQNIAHENNGVNRFHAQTCQSIGFTRWSYVFKLMNVYDYIHETHTHWSCWQLFHSLVIYRHQKRVWKAPVPYAYFSVFLFHHWVIQNIAVTQQFLGSVMKCRWWNSRLAIPGLPHGMWLVSAAFRFSRSTDTRLEPISRFVSTTPLRQPLTLIRQISRPGVYGWLHAYL